MKVTKDYFGRTGIEQGIFLFTIENKNGTTVRLTNFGATITSILVADKNGDFDDVVLGFDNIDQYIGNHPYLGVTCGRYANRIAKGKFTIDGIEYSLAINNGPNSLHGGKEGFDKAIWNAEEFKNANEAGVKFSFISPDMQEGYPGNLHVEVVISLNNDNEVSIKYTATTDKATVLNLTNHSYFNLNGGKSDVLGHLMQINADSFTEIDETSIPTGKFIDVTGNGFDFRVAKPIGQDINKVAGYDHNYVLNKTQGGELSFAAKAADRESGRIMEVKTTEPGIQFYSANFLDGSIKGKDGIILNKQYGFCLETQHYPDSPNKPNFPSTLLRPGQTYNQLTIYKFGIE